ncbi:MAG: hypothetical protein U0Q16_03575 [Bryobacteraceae bacterium]
MTFLVKNERPETVITPQQTQGMAPYAQVSEGQLAVELELLSSRAVLRAVAVACGLDSTAGVRGTPDQQIEAAIQNLRKKVRVQPVLKANMIRVKYAAYNRTEAESVLRELAKAYMEQHLKIHGNNGAVFFGHQSHEAEDKLRKAQRELAAFQTRNNLVLLGVQKDLVLRRCVEAEAALRAAEVAQAESEQRAIEAKGNMSGLAARITTQVRRVPNQYSAERLNTMLVELENKRTELLMKFRADDRVVVQANQQIADTRRALEAARQAAANEEATDLNPLRQSLETESVRSRTDANAAGRRATVLRGQLAHYRAELARLEALTGEHDALSRQVRELESNYTLYSRKFEESRVEEALDRQKFTNVSLAQPPAVPEFPMPRPWTAIGGLGLAGLASILAAAMITGRASRFVHTPSTLEQLTGVPVLGTLPVSAQSRAAGLLDQAESRGARVLAVQAPLSRESQS